MALAFDELRDSVIRNPPTNPNCSGCPRNIKGRLSDNRDLKNRERFPIFLRRTDGLEHARFMVVSQEPGFGLRRECSSSSEADEFLRAKCSSVSADGNRLPNCIVHIFGHTNLFDGVYWTHCLKCIPYDSDKDVMGEWFEAAPRCSRILLNELEMLTRCRESERPFVVAIGGRAMTMCNHILNDSELKPLRVLNFVRGVDYRKKIDFRENSVYFLSFVHPANRKRVLATYDQDGVVRTKEKMELGFIKSNIHHPIPQKR
jgi:hypothetical protein